LVKPGHARERRRGTKRSGTTRRDAARHGGAVARTGLFGEWRPGELPLRCRRIFDLAIIKWSPCVEGPSSSSSGTKGSSSSLATSIASSGGASELGRARPLPLGRLLASPESGDTWGEPEPWPAERRWAAKALGFGFWSSWVPVTPRLRSEVDGVPAGDEEADPVFRAAGRAGGVARPLPPVADPTGRE
jgi:hypothetical protein